MYRNPSVFFLAVFLLVGIIGMFARHETIMLIGFSGFILFTLTAANRKSKNYYQLSINLEKQIKDMVPGIKDFKLSQEFMSVDKESYIALDETNKKICIIYNQETNTEPLLSKNEYNYKCEIFFYKDILQSTILHDSFTVTSSSRTDIIGRASLGRSMAGNTGAIIGGLSASRTTLDLIKKVQLLIVVNNMSTPFHRITFENFPKGITKDNIMFKSVDNEITHWHAMLSFLIKQVDETDKPPNANQISVADELLKLSSLLRDNLITEDEFKQQKIRLLG